MVLSIMKKIKLTKGKYAIVDYEDFHYLTRFKWRVIRQERKATDINPVAIYERVGRTVNNRTIFMEYFILSLDNKNVVFKNGNNFDFRKKNMLPINKSLVVHRQRKHFIKENSNFRSQYKNVTKRIDSKGKQYQARISFNGKRINLGFFDSEKEAAIAYNIKARELYGGLAYQNKI